MNVYCHNPRCPAFGAKTTAESLPGDCAECEQAVRIGKPRASMTAREAAELQSDVAALYPRRNK
jgi:hypothetical protein